MGAFSNLIFSLGTNNPSSSSISDPKKTHMHETFEFLSTHVINIPPRVTRHFISRGKSEYSTFARFLVQIKRVASTDPKKRERFIWSSFWFPISLFEFARWYE